MKKNLFLFSATMGFSLSLWATPQTTSPSLVCKGQSTQFVQNFIANNNTFLLKLGFGDLDRSFYFGAAGVKMSSKVEYGPWMDHSDLMKKYRENNFTYNQMSLNQLNRNIRAYEAVKAAKELGLYISALTLPCINETGHQEKMANLTAYLTAMKPLDISETVKSLVKQRLHLELKKAATEKPEEVDKIVQEELNVAISVHSKHLVSLLSQALFGSDSLSTEASKYQKDVTDRLMKLMTPVVHILYLDHQIGRTQWLGRALIALQLRNGGVEAQRVLKQELMASGITMENIVGETWLMATENLKIHELEQSFLANLNKLRSENKISLAQALELKDRFDEKLHQWIQDKPAPKNKAVQTESPASLLSTLSPLKERLFLGAQKSLAALKAGFSYENNQVPIPVHTMSYVLTRNINVESAQTPSLALPGNVEIGKEFNLVGSLLSGLNVIDADYVAEHGYGFLARLQDRSFYRILNNGFSHVGYVAVRRADGISMTWVVDNYPTPAADSEIDIPGARFNAGGVRWVGLEQFYKFSQHTKIGVMTPDAKLFHEYAKPQIQKRLEAIAQGQEVLGTKMYSAVQPVLDASGKPTHVDVPTDDPWTMEIDNATFQKIHQFDNDEQWFESVTEAAMDKMKDFMYQGMSFVWITPYGQYYKGGGYCSYTGVLGYSLGTGIEVLSTHKDQWSPLLKGLASIHQKAVTGLSQLKNSQMDKSKKNILEKQLKALVENSTLQDAATAVSVDIYTPSGLPSQSYVTQKNVYQAVAPFRDIHSRYALLFDKNQKAFEEYSTMGHGYLDNEGTLTPVALDPSEVRGIQLDLLETFNVKYSK